MPGYVSLIDCAAPAAANAFVLMVVQFTLNRCIELFCIVVITSFKYVRAAVEISVGLLLVGVVGVALSPLHAVVPRSRVASTRCRNIVVESIGVFGLGFDCGSTNSVGHAVRCQFGHSSSPEIEAVTWPRESVAETCSEP